MDEKLTRLQAMKDRIHALERDAEQLEQDIRDEEDNWLYSPTPLVIGKADSAIAGYRCQYKMTDHTQWCKGHIVGMSFDSSRLYKVRKNNGDYEWPKHVRVRPKELKTSMIYNIEKAKRSIAETSSCKNEGGLF